MDQSRRCRWTCRKTPASRADYRLKLNSYDLGVDIELADAVQRIRFEHPEVHTVVITSLKERIFCAGANIFMLRGSSHAWKVNFCKYTNETRLAIEDASEHSGIKFLAAINGICAGGGYELALAATKSFWSTMGIRRSVFPKRRCSACCLERAVSRASWTRGRFVGIWPTCSGRSPKA